MPGVTIVTLNGAPTGEFQFDSSLSYPDTVNLNASISDSSGNPTSIGSDMTQIGIAQ